jgi:hypothetical protein
VDVIAVTQIHIQALKSADGSGILNLSSKREPADARHFLPEVFPIAGDS